MSSEIPSAFLIRALARHPAEHCDRCGHRMFVRQPSGLCPFCRADRPPRPAAHAAMPGQDREPFAPLLDARDRWRSLPLGRRARDLVMRARRPAKRGPLATPT